MNRRWVCCMVKYTPYTWALNKWCVQRMLKTAYAIIYMMLSNYIYCAILSVFGFASFHNMRNYLMGNVLDTWCEKNCVDVSYCIFGCACSCCLIREADCCVILTAKLIVQILRDDKCTLIFSGNISTTEG